MRQASSRYSAIANSGRHSLAYLSGRPLPGLADLVGERSPVQRKMTPPRHQRPCHLAGLLGGRAAKVRRGRPVVSTVAAGTPAAIPSGLIHDWIGGIFTANTTLHQVLRVVRDYERYKECYRPAVIDSKSVSLTEDHFWLILANKVLFRSISLDSDYKSTHVELDRRRSYAIALSTCNPGNRRLWRSRPACFTGR